MDFDFFHERVEEASVGIPLSEDTRLYLVDLLSRRLRVMREEPTTLAELYFEAYHAPDYRKAQAYRALGDRALHVVGCFRDSLNRSPVGPSYYVDMGSSAYGRTHGLFSGAFGPVFYELATRFEDCALVLETVSHEGLSTDDLVSLYEQWMETKSETLKKRLVRAGVVLL